MGQGRGFITSRVAALTAVLWFVATVATPASMPPRYRFQTFHAGRVRVHFHAEVEGPARRATALVLEILPRLEERYKVRVPSLDVVVHDVFDSPNGLATSFPYPLVEIRTASTDGADSGPTESWLRMVVTHELTHIVHIEQAGGLYGLGRRVFGRAPFLFPDALQPTWFIEGLAVREETRGTAFGRGRHAFTRMVVDEAARSGDLALIDRATLGLDRWPLGQAPYLFGEQFLDFIERTHGEGAVRDIALEQASSFRPYRDSKAFQKVTGAPLATLWKDFATSRRESLRPVPKPSLLTSQGVVQTAPRLSPDRSVLAYTSRALDRRGEVRLMKPDGSDDRRLTWRFSGSGLSWTRDGRFIIFDDLNQVRKFEQRSDLYRVDVATGHRERLTTGMRASDPDAGTGRGGETSIVFVQRFPDRSELSLLGASGRARVLTRSPPGTEWSHPRFSPSGDAIVSARLSNGFMDLVVIDAETGAARALANDRALDAEPAWVDDDRVIFRSDREGEAFQLFIVNRDGSNPRRLDPSPQNAFAPEVDAARSIVFYASYSARGYDIAHAPLREGPAMAAYLDPFPAPEPEPEPFAGESKGYRAMPYLRPHFVSPFVERAADEWRPGLATFSFDPLIRVAYGLAATWGTRVGRPNALGYLRYDRLATSFTAFARVESSPSAASRRDVREGRLSIDFPLERSLLRVQTLSLTARRRREETAGVARDSGVLALGFQLDSTRTYPGSVSPQDGQRLRFVTTREVGSLGSDFDFGKIILDAASYGRLGSAVVVARVGGGLAYGPVSPPGVFAVGGLSSPAILDPTSDEPAVLRGYKAPDGRDASRYGRRLIFGNLDWRVPLAHPQRGIGTFPVFLQHLSLAFSLDAAVVSSRALRASSARVGVSVGLSAHLFVGHRLPVTIHGGMGRGLTRDGATVPWFSLGFPF